MPKTYTCKSTAQDDVPAVVDGDSLTYTCSYYITCQISCQQHLPAEFGNPFNTPGVTEKRLTNESPTMIIGQREAQKNRSILPASAGLRCTASARTQNKERHDSTHIQVRG